MHGQMKQKKRLKIYNQFKAEKDKPCILATTDVVARGIDFTDVELIIQFDPPQDPSFFVHRAGRTARSGRSGEDILLLENNEQGFVSYLKSKQITMQLLDPLPNQIENLKEEIHQIITSDRDIIEKGKRAFVSYIRSYKEHKLQVIFSFAKMNIGQAAQSFFLFRMPRIKEILGRKIDFEQSEIDPNQVQFVDKNKEKQFLEKKQKKQEKEDDKIQESHKIQFHNQYQNKEINVKNNKSLRKKIKNLHDYDEGEELVRQEIISQDDFFKIREQNLVKKLKKGKISIKEFNKRMKELDPEDFMDEEFEKKVIY